MGFLLYWLYELTIYPINNPSPDKTLSVGMGHASALADTFRLCFRLSNVVPKFSIHCSENASGISGVTK